jgi:hypothetical protein
MNKTELESILKKARLPEIGADSLEKFPRRVLARLVRSNRQAHAARRIRHALRGSPD